MMPYRQRTRKSSKAKVISLAVASCFSASVATAVLANPSGFSVINGQAAFNYNGNVLTITNTPGSIINWRSFSIGANELTRFIQQSSASSVLNRVIGVDPSIILGALQSNGRVFLINPSGILFGAGAQINVAGLVVSPLNLSNADFLADRLRFTDVAGAGSVVNQGAITTPSGGQVYLIAPNVQNHGIINSPRGEVILAAGKSVELVDAGTPNLRVEITAPDNEALNVGKIIAGSGKVGIYGGLIRNSGTIKADGLVVGANGEILLKATKNTTIDSGSVISANGAQGGNVTIQSGDATLVSGTIEAKGSEGRGGDVHILGGLVELTEHAGVDASGETGGGTILIGGDYQGKNTGIQNAWRTYVGNDVNLRADAISDGDGGKVIVWSDDTTRFDGYISARGGVVAGDGGFAEISGKQHLALTGFADLRAPNGRAGTLLLDPGTVTVCHLLASCAVTQSGLDIFSDDYISTQLGFGNLTITTASASAGPLDINFVDPSISINWSNSSILTFLAGNSINQQGSISGTSSLSDVEFIATGGNLTMGGRVIVGGYAILRATAGAIIDNNGAANNVTAQYLEAAAANGINLDTAISGASPSYVNATNSTSGDISLRNTTATAVVQNIHNAGGNNNLSGLLTDSESTIITGGIVFHGEWPDPGSPGRTIETNPALTAPYQPNPRYSFTTDGSGVTIIENSPRANTFRTDPYLFLLDANGVVLRTDDDSGQGYVSRINEPALPAGTYTVVAGNFRTGSPSPFDLSIGGLVSTTLIPPPPPPLPPPPQQAEAIIQAVSVNSIAAINQSTDFTPAADKEQPDADDKKAKEKEETTKVQAICR